MTASRHHLLLGAGLLMLASLLMGCTTLAGTVAGGEGAQNTPAPQMATAEVGAITGVLTLTGTVTQGAEYAVHAAIAGRVMAVAPDVIVLSGDDGTVLEVRAPEAARLTTPVVGVGDRVVPGMALARAIVPGFSIVMPLGGADLLRFIKTPLGLRAQIDDGPGPFDCQMPDPVPTVSDDGSLSGAEGMSATLVCIIPADIRVLAGMSATAVVTLEHLDDTIVLPVEAVAGTIQSGSVYLLDPYGEAEQRGVVLGPTDGRRIAILDGIVEGDEVLIPGPWLALHE